MLVLVLTLSVGLGVSCLLLLIILHLCSLYRTEESPGSSQATPLAPVNLDSDTVDYNDINSQLYTPLPQPKIMKISEEVTINNTIFKICFIPMLSCRPNSVKSQKDK